MKAQGIVRFYVILLILGITFPSGVYSQSNVPDPTCVSCGGKNGMHATTCRYYNPPAGKPKSQTTGVPGNVQQLNSLIDLFNTPAVDQETQAEKEAAIKEAHAEKQREDMLKKERHDREMKTFKPLDDEQGGVNFHAPANSGLSLKPLPAGNAPMTMEERERQNILKQNANITWNFNEFSSVSPGSQIPEPPPATELSDNEKLINDVIGMVESNGGRLAAIAGRYIINVKDGVMNYLDDAAYAVTSGNSYVMQETGEFDVKKITTNAIYKTTTQTVQAYSENAMDAVKTKLTDDSIGILKQGSINKLEEYKYFDNLSKAWKQTH